MDWTMREALSGTDVGKWTSTSSANQEDRGKTGLIPYAKTWRPLVWPG